MTDKRFFVHVEQRTKEKTVFVSSSRLKCAKNADFAGMQACGGAGSLCKIKSAA